MADLLFSIAKKMTQKERERENKAVIHNMLQEREEENCIFIASYVNL